MSNLANYSPYNKSYKFILFQNQAYHQKNKRNMSPVVRTNLRHSLSRGNSNKNPQKFELNMSNHFNSSMRESQSVNSSLFGKNKQIKNPIIDEQKRIVHKNWSYQKFKQKKINADNKNMVQRLLKLDCEVVKNTCTNKSFQDHLKYQNIRRRYNQHGQRKDFLPLSNSQLLCPTLAQFNTSGLAGKFVQLDMSMSIKPLTAQSSRRNRMNHSQL